MKKYSNQTENFINQYVLVKLGYDTITSDNISEIVDYIVDNYEVPLAQAKEAGEQIDEHLLKIATDAVTEITSDENW